MSATERNLFLGCDPGVTGAFALLDHAGAIVDVEPLREKTAKDISDYLEEFGERIEIALLEAVHAMPKQGVSSSFTFGRGYGRLEMAFVCRGIRFEYVQPGKWQQPLGCIVTGRKETRGTRDKKQLTKARAQELFPQQKITHAIADALLIAEYCRRVHSSQLRVTG